jgi:geranylgeranyl diphosphate synthase, type II
MNLQPETSRISSKLPDWQVLFAGELPAIEAALDRATRPPTGCPQRLSDAIRYAVLAPGKRLRPLLVLAAARACGGSVEAALPAAVAVELIHAYSLVHDDLPAMDDDDLRRGRPTVHIEFDEATAILVGDALIPLAFEVLSTQVEPASVALACCRELALAAGQGRLVGGQADDLCGEQAGITDSLNHLESIHLRKTAAMLAVSLKLGGLVAGADGATGQHLEQFGRELGLAFQITDDLLDFHGDPAKMGKRGAKDHQRGKLTYPVLIGPAESRRLAEEAVQRAIHHLAPLGQAAEPLVELARLVLSRIH